MGSSDDDDEWLTAVVDLGSKNIQVGIAGDDTPRIAIDTSTCLTQPPKSRLVNKHKCYVEIEDYLDVGHEVRYPLSGGTDFEQIEALLYYSLYDQLHLTDEKLEGCTALFTEPLFHAQKEREGLMELMFEKFNVQGYHVSPSPMLSLYASGRGSGIVVESGHSITQTLIIYEGYNNEGCAARVDIGGKDVTQRLMEYSGYKYSVGQYNRIKKLYSYVNYDDAMDRSKEDMVLPDGTQVSVSEEALSQCGHVMFDFSLGGETRYKSIQDMVYDTIMTADIYCRRHMFTNIILSGGNTLIDGFERKLHQEFKALADLKHKCVYKVVAPPDREYSAWIGGSILGSLSTFHGISEYIISRDEYKEEGARMLTQKCTPIKGK